MSITPWKSWQEELNTLRQQMDRVWHDFGDWLGREHQLQPLPKIEDALWGPSIELQETDSEIILKAQIPGVEAKDLDVQVTENAVSIAGEHREENRTEEKGFYRSEFQYGQFQRLVPLPARINHEQVQSQFKNGLLTLTLPKVENASRNAVRVNIQEAARVGLTENRQGIEHQQDTMLNRSKQELTSSANELSEAARTEVAEQREEDVQQKEKMRTRAR